MNYFYLRYFHDNIFTDTYCYYDRENYSFEAFHISFFVSSFALPVVYSSLLSLKRIIIINVIQIGFTIIHWVSVRDGLTRKNCYSFGFCPNYLSPPPPNLDNLYNFFRPQNSWFESHFRTKILYYTIYILYITSQNNRFKFKLLAFWLK